METAKKLVQPDGATLHYRLWTRADAPRSARGTVIVLLHGMASNMTRWSEFLEHTSLKEHFDILRTDLRGHGESFTRRKIGMKIWCRDLAAILDAEGYERAIVIGHSLGANVALRFSAYQPARVAAIALIDPVFTQALRGTVLWIHRTSWWWRPLIALARVFNRLGIRRRIHATRDLRQLDNDVRQHLLGAGRDREFVQRYSSPLADLRHFSAANYLQEIIELTRRVPPPEKLHVPLLALVSQAVTFTRTQITRQILARYPHVEIVDLSAYHWPLTEKPVEVRQALERWCLQLKRK
jgi:esterase